MSSDNHLRNFIHELAELLRGDVELKVDQTLSKLEEFREKLDGIHSNYDEDSEDGQSQVAILMRESIESFYNALDNLEQFIEEPDDALLDEAKVEADRGAILLADVMERSSLQGLSGPLYGC